MTTIVDRQRVTAALDEVWDVLFGLAGELDPDDWSRPTACPSWSVQDCYSHCLGTEALLLDRPLPDVDLPDNLPHVRNDIGRINEVWVTHYRSMSPPEVVAEFRRAVDERRRALAAMDDADFLAESFTPAGPDTYGRFMRTRVMDQWMHEQDVREAAGRPGHLVGLAPELALDEVTAALGYVVGKKAALPAGSSVRFELTGDLARRIDVKVGDRARVVEALAGTPTVSLTLPGERFMRLCGGRVADGAAEAAADADVHVGGDAELGARLLAELGFMI
ncbi:MAG TPA: maleylpyruvate isomerase family mycothiol-dependent enzyme [Acidimicrobiales bacterium]|jgi:uncharacterized protein (TIGR03083 family)|nr:maleylpyruvate isomerase family mycothiol-dependent enzyme [Acidimicrobiales bacterium]